MASSYLKHVRAFEKAVDDLEVDVASAVQELHELICDVGIPVQPNKEKAAICKKFEELQKFGTEKELKQFFHHLMQAIGNRVRKTLSYIENRD